MTPLYYGTNLNKTNTSLFDASRNPPLATENLENTDGVLRPHPPRSIPSAFSRDSSLLPSFFVVLTRAVLMPALFQRCRGGTGHHSPNRQRPQWLQAAERSSRSKGSIIAPTCGSVGSSLRPAALLRVRTTTTTLISRMPSENTTVQLATQAPTQPPTPALRLRLQLRLKSSGRTTTGLIASKPTDYP